MTALLNKKPDQSINPEVINPIITNMYQFNGYNFRESNNFLQESQEQFLLRKSLVIFRGQVTIKKFNYWQFGA